MTSPNHIVGGLAITGVIGSLMGINILEEESYIGITVFASLLPDIDHTKSPIGKLFYPIARTINRRFGHRTITHTIFSLLVTWALAATIGKVYYETTDYGTIFFLGYLSHLVLDMMTVQGVPLFYPFIKSPCVIPGDPSLRMQSSDIKAELTAFIFFCLMFVFFQPLMATGFWTQYNQLFGTMKHLSSEYNKSDDLLEVTYEAQKGSEAIEGKGIVIEAKESKALIIENGDFKILDKADMVIKEVMPTHTGRKFYFDTKHFIGVSEDSLNRMLIDQYIRTVEIHSNQPFATWANGTLQPISDKFKGELFNNLYVQKVEVAAAIVEEYVPVHNPQIAIIKDKLERTRVGEALRQNSSQALITSISQLKTKIQQETDVVRKELLYDQLQELEQQKVPKDHQNTIAELEIKIQELVKLDAIKNATSRKAHNKKNQVQKQPDNKYTGSVTIIRLP